MLAPSRGLARAPALASTLRGRLLPCAARPCPPPALPQPHAPPLSRHSGGPQQLPRPFAAAPCSGGPGSGADAGEDEASEASDSDDYLETWEEGADDEGYEADGVQGALKLWEVMLEDLLERVAEQAARELAPALLEQARAREVVVAMTRSGEAAAAAKAALEVAGAEAATTTMSLARALKPEGEEGLLSWPGVAWDAGAGAGAAPTDAQLAAAVARIKRAVKAKTPLAGAALAATVRNLGRSAEAINTCQQAVKGARKAQRETRAVVARMDESVAALEALLWAAIDEVAAKVRAALGTGVAAAAGEAEAEEAAEE
ncbi:hypothetical protein HYH03_008481 [Edaphochlamys debaryana]|uniref:Uncharacterized protein n=1 Tax=Edaphochlamys debaryana TaxID=47281 RepID=A0A836BZF2_9CHLO|nr:hypothetical protein HYH03_008481 [Edaphochlamys debaryana]|eukprot:KAG2493348.1 hypothetical protein HYH03_008481 [Edaphochlamys debaryana]